MNGDGYLDIVAGTKRNSGDTSGSADIFFSNTLPLTRFTTVYTTAVGGSVYGLGTARMESDGSADVVVALRAGSNTGKCEFWHNNGTMTGSLTLQGGNSTAGAGTAVVARALVCNS